jgi:hypothetical protein
MIMPPKIPYELAHARMQREAAYEMYGEAIENNKPNDVKQRLADAADAWDEICQLLYHRWQKLGGTSDIESIEAAESTTAQLTESAYMQADLDGTHPSPIISGGEVLDLEAYNSTLSEDELPF